MTNKYLLKISEIGKEEQLHGLEGTLQDVYDFVQNNCESGQFVDVYENNEYLETLVRMNGGIARVTYVREW